MFCVVFVAVAGIAWLAFDIIADWAIGVAAAFGVLALAMPWVLMPLNRLWGRFSLRLGKINNVVLLGLFFCLVVWPVGVLMRLFGNDPMCRKLNPQSTTHWVKVTRVADDETVRDLF